MPAIRRNIGANVPAAAGNGRPCYRGNAPSCQRLMKFSYTLSGTIDFTPLYPHWKSEVEEDGRVWDPSRFQASSIDAVWLSDALVRPEYYPDWDITILTGYYNEALFPNLEPDENFPGLFGVPDPQGVRVAWLRGWWMAFGVIWDATAWRWAAKLGVTMAPEFKGGGHYTLGPWTTFHTWNNPGGSYALFASAQSAQNIRLGAQGWNLYFDSIVGNDAIPGAAAALQNVVINLKAAWA